MPNTQQREFIFQKLGYTPNPLQAEIHNSQARTKQVAGGERSGKSYLSANELLSRFHEGTLYWLVGSEYANTRAEYDYICDGLDKLGITYQATKHIDPGEIEIEGGFSVITKSAKDPRKLGIQAPDGVIICEAAQIDYETYLRLRGRIAEKRGWMLLSGTFETSLGWYPEMFNAGQIPENPVFRSFSLPTWTNLAIFPGGRQDPEILSLERASSKDWFMERYGGTPCPPKGRVFTEFVNNVHVGELKFDPILPVYLWVDPGYAHYYAVEAIQRKEGITYVIDEIYEHGLVTSDIITVCRQKPWWNKVIGGAIDVAARQHQAMPAVAEIWSKESGITLRSRKIRIQDGIEVFKANLKVNPLTSKPAIFIDHKCQGLISELGGAPNPDTGRTAVYSWRADREGNIIGDVPEDKNCDAVKAVIYGLIDLVGYTPAQQTRPKTRFF